MLCLFAILSSRGQNLVPNPSFEIMNGCEDFANPDVICSQAWSEFLDLDFSNTPDIGYEGALFFPPSTIDAHDGNQYLNLECTPGNPEYIQASLIQPLSAGTTYCVSFYASVTLESPEVAPSLGVYFSENVITDSPFELGLNAHVQGPINFDPTTWTLISGTYTATGSENYIVLSGFENTGTQPWPYMYIDDVSVIPMPSLNLISQDLCDGPFVLDAFASGANYLWNTGAITSSITVSTEGTFSLVRTIGVCSQEETIIVVPCEEDTTDSEEPDPSDSIVDPIDKPDSTLVEIIDYHFYIPNAFTPNEDGNNDQFYVVGPDTDSFQFQIFNRWGQIVFQSFDISTRWIGNDINGNYYLPDGVYIYRMKATIDTEIFEETGHVLLIR